MSLGTKPTQALLKGIDKVKAFRVHPSDVGIAEDGSRLDYAYFAEETESYWLVSEDSLFVLGARNLDYDDWAEGDSNAKEFGRRAPRSVS